MKEIEEADRKLLEKSKKIKQISNWVEDWKKLRHFKQTIPNLLLCQKKVKNGKGEKITVYAVFAKTIGKGIKLKKRDLAKIRF